MKKTLIIVFITLFYATFSFAQEQHPIDKFLEDEISKDSTTAGMNNATLKAMGKWNIELNKYYKLLMGILDTKSTDMLKASQRAWVEYRDKEFENINNIFGQLQGTMYTTVAIDNKLAIVKTRAEDLKQYYELLLEQKPIK